MSPLQGFGKNLKTIVNGDEYYSPQNVVDVIVPHILEGGWKSVWCPFDKDESLFVKTFRELGLRVVNGHIETGQDFFEYTTPQAEVVVSNPPFSRREQILESLYRMNVPFALVLNFNGLFDSKYRWQLFRDHGVEILVPKGRMRFMEKNKGILNSPSFQSVYVCSGVLKQQIVFSDKQFFNSNKSITGQEEFSFQGG